MALSKLIIANMALQKIGAKKITSLDIAVDTSDEAASVAACYDSIRNLVLCETLWTFAQKRAYLAKVITGATQTNPVVISSTAHGFIDGDTVVITDVVGMTQLNAQTFTVTASSANAFSLLGINGIPYAAYVSGGFATKKYMGAFNQDGMTAQYARPSDMLRLNYVSDTSAVIRLEGQSILSDTYGLSCIYTYQNDDPTTYYPSFGIALSSRLAYELCFFISESVSKAQEVFEAYEKVDLPRAKAQDSQQGTPQQVQQSEWENARLAGGSNFVNPTTSAATWHPGI